MGNIFVESEVVELGIQIEKNGKDFYATLAEKSKNKDAQQIFKYLAGEEEKHIADFQKILDSVHKYEPVESYPGEYFAYMNALASEYVFTEKDQGTELAKATATDQEAVDMGIRFEKESIIFYDGMKQVVPDKDHKTIDALIAQEKDHLIKLIDLKKSC